MPSGRGGWGHSGITANRCRELGAIRGRAQAEFDQGMQRGRGVVPGRGNLVSRSIPGVTGNHEETARLAQGALWGQRDKSLVCTLRWCLVQKDLDAR